MNKTKCIVLLTLIALLFSTSGAYSIGHVDGNDWLEFNNIEKEIYLEGIFDGLNLMLVGMLAGFEPDREITEIILELEEEGELFLLQEDDYNNAINSVNELYSNEDNLDVSVLELFLEGEVMEEDIDF